MGIEVSPGFCLMSAALVLVVPVSWTAAAFAAGAFHELCHLLVIRVLGGRAGTIRVGLAGAVIPVAGLSFRQEWMAAAAGPLGSLALLAVRRLWPELAVCGMIQGAFNLLPVYPLDGGRMVLCLLLSCLGPEAGERTAAVVGRLTAAAVLAAGAFLTFWGGFHPVPLVISLEIAGKAKNTLQRKGSGHIIG